MQKTLGLFLAGIFLLSGCSDKSAPSIPTPPPEPERTEFSFTSTNELVSSEQISPANKASTVSADFNMDGLQDMAVVDSTEDGAEKVSIYIQKAPTTTHPTSQPVYYMGGAIQRGTEGRITGVMTRRGKKYTDLIVLVSHTNGPNEMAHYRNDGQKFNVVALHESVRESSGSVDLIDPSLKKVPEL